MKRQILFWSSILTILFFSCSKGKTEIELTGLLKKQGATTYQYGTHTLTVNSTLYALTSKTLNLDTYINQSVTITGDKVNGYPVDGGPEYIDVKSIK